MTTLLNEDQAMGKDKDLLAHDVTVDVTPVFGNGTVCEIEAGDGPSHAFVHGGVINLHGHSSFQVTWQLQAGTPAGLEFDCANDTTPIWSSQAGCPTGYCQDPQVTFVSCTANTLVILVTPQRPANAVHISLGWSNGQRFDPIIINN